MTDPLPSNQSSSQKPFSISQKFPKSERLTSKVEINRLFAEGKSFFIFPYKVFFLSKDNLEEDESLPKVLISVSKRNFKKAPDRNRIKRQIREVYRTQKGLFSLQKIASIAFICVAKSHEETSFFKKRMRKVLVELSKKP